MTWKASLELISLSAQSESSDPPPPTTWLCDSSPFLFLLVPPLLSCTTHLLAPNPIVQTPFIYKPCCPAVPELHLWHNRGCYPILPSVQYVTLHFFFISLLGSNNYKQIDRSCVKMWKNVRSSEITPPYYRSESNWVQSRPPATTSCHADLTYFPQESKQGLGRSSFHFTNRSNFICRGWPAAAGMCFLNAEKLLFFNKVCCNRLHNTNRITFLPVYFSILNRFLSLLCSKGIPTRDQTSATALFSCVLGSHCVLACVCRV